MPGNGACCAALRTLHRDARTTRTVFEVPADHRQVRGNLHPQVSGHRHGRGETPKRNITQVFTSPRYLKHQILSHFVGSLIFAAFVFLPDNQDLSPFKNLFNPTLIFYKCQYHSLMWVHEYFVPYHQRMFGTQRARYFCDHISKHKSEIRH